VKIPSLVRRSLLRATQSTGESRAGVDAIASTGAGLHPHSRDANGRIDR
jgi:hypothetical protein